MEVNAGHLHTHRMPGLCLRSSITNDNTRYQKVRLSLCEGTDREISNLIGQEAGIEGACVCRS